jgi:hypothetical protein
VRPFYNYRSDVYGALTMGSQIVTDAYKQFDVTSNWNLTEDMSVFVAAVNIM